MDAKQYEADIQYKGSFITEFSLYEFCEARLSNWYMRTIFSVSVALSFIKRR